MPKPYALWPSDALAEDPGEGFGVLHREFPLEGGVEPERPVEIARVDPRVAVGDEVAPLERGRSGQLLVEPSPVAGLPLDEVAAVVRREVHAHVAS